MTGNRAVILGIVADTHGYLDARLGEAFRGVDAIVHAGDMGTEAVLSGLGQIAPVHAVFGNNDGVVDNLGLPERLDLEFGGVRLHVVHQVEHARPLPGTDVVVFGHSHRQVAEWRDGVLYLNPGAAGRRGFHSLQTAALLSIAKGKAQAQLITLGPRLVAAPRQVRPR